MSMFSARAGSFFAFFGLALLVLWTCHDIGFGAEPQTGKALYLQHCSSCHGQEGHGNGPVSRYLSVKVPDLTLIKKRNNGIYPSDGVTAAIDGRRQIRGHGDRQMPVWGEIFTIEEQRHPERASISKAKLITKFIAQLQQ
ncbi:MAG: c-type cytochrome [Chloroflexota bacterium]